MRNGNDLDPLDLVSRYVWRGRKDASRYLYKGHLDSYVTTCRSLPTEEQFSSNGRVANRHSLIRTLMNDGTFVSLVQRGTGLTDIRGRMYVARPKKQTNLKVKRGRVIRLISRLWQQCALATDRPPAPPLSPLPSLFRTPTASQKSSIPLRTYYCYGRERLACRIFFGKRRNFKQFE